MTPFSLPLVHHSDNLFVMLMVGLAAWRMSNMLIDEEGPYKVFVKMRERFGITHIDDRPVSWPEGSVLACVWCLSVWMVLLLGVLPIAVSFWLAASAIAIIVKRYVDG